MFDNDYEKENPLQMLWDTTEGSCLCGRFESCAYCNGSLRPIKKQVLQMAKDQGYQIYYKISTNQKLNKIDYEYVTKTFNLK